MQFTPYQRIAFRLFALLFLLAFIALQITAARADSFKPTRFTVTVECQGPDVIMIPGLAASASVWRHEADKLKAHYRLHLIQVLGFAGTQPGGNAADPIVASTVEEIAGYVRANNLHPAVI